MKSFACLYLIGALATAKVLPRQNANSPMDLSEIAAAPPPSITGPPVAAVTDAINYNAASASSTGSAAASVTGSSNFKRTFCWSWGPYTWGYCAPSTTAKPTTRTGSTSAPTTASSSTCSTTPYTPYYPAVTTGTATQYRTPTAVSSGATACPTTPEAGTYCGFINPLDDCAPQPDGYGPIPVPDTAEAFLAYPLFSQLAKTAVTPAGYTLNFTGLNAGVQGPSYLALKTLQTYSPADCAAYCDCTETCSAFNVYIERDPNLNPAASCPNPPSMTSYRCMIFAGPISAADATNSGQYRNDFHVVITGSNGYNKLPAAPHLPSCPSWQPPTYCPGGAISAPGKQMGGAFFPGPFDPRVCSAYALAQTAKNKASCPRGQHYDACNYYNAYAVKKNGSYAGLYCNLFTDKPGYGDGPSSGSYTGCKSGSTAFDVAWSWSYQVPVNNWNNGWNY